MDLLSSEKRKPKENIIPDFNYKDRYRGDRTKLLEMHSEKLEGTSHKSYQGKC